MSNLSLTKKLKSYFRHLPSRLKGDSVTSFPPAQFPLMLFLYKNPRLSRFTEECESGKYMYVASEGKHLQILSRMHTTSLQNCI